MHNLTSGQYQTYPEHVDDNASILSGCLSAIWEKCGGMGAQEVRTGTVRVVKLMTELMRRREANMTCGTSGSCWRAFFGYQYAYSWCQTMSCVRTTAAKSNSAVLYGPSAELYFFFVKKDVKCCSMLLPKGQA